VLGNLGWEHLLVLAVVGLVIFGPDRLPRAAADAAKLLRQLRAMAGAAATDLKAELGPEMADLDLRSLHPRELVRQALRDDDGDSDGRDGTGRSGAARDGADGYSAQLAAVAPLLANERPPYDPDAT
jgi:sec-independent protein translocase protein TatB